MCRLATLEEAQEIFLELGAPADSKKQRFEQALKRTREADPNSPISPHKAERLFRGYFDKLELHAHEYVALIRAKYKKAAEQERTFRDSLANYQRAAVRDLEQLTQESADIDRFILDRRAALGARAGQGRPRSR